MTYPNTDDKPSASYKDLLMYRDSFSLPEGQVVLQYPAKMSVASYQYFVRSLQIVLDKAKDSIDNPEGDLGL